MKHKPTKIKKVYLISSLLILILGFFLTVILANREAGEYEEAQRNAMERMERAEAYIKERIIEKGIEIEDIDLNRTGLIGPEFTELTSTPGEEGAKRRRYDCNRIKRIFSWLLNCSTYCSKRNENRGTRHSQLRRFYAWSYKSGI